MKSLTTEVREVAETSSFGSVVSVFSLVDPFFVEIRSMP